MSPDRHRVRLKEHLTAVTDYLWNVHILPSPVLSFCAYMMPFLHCRNELWECDMSSLDQLILWININTLENLITKQWPLFFRWFVHLQLNSPLESSLNLWQKSVFILIKLPLLSHWPQEWGTHTLTNWRMSRKHYWSKDWHSWIASSLLLPLKNTAMHCSALCLLHIHRPTHVSQLALQVLKFNCQ